METADPKSAERLCAEIRAEAQRASEQVVRQARDEAATLLAQAAATADQARRERLAQARTEAARRQELILATVPVEVGRQRAAETEALLQGIFEQARRQLQSRRPSENRAAVIRLAAEAVKHMEGETFVVKLPAAQRAALGDGLAEEITRRLGHLPASIRVSFEPTFSGDGLVVQDLEGRQTWDNHLPARLERLWPELRRQIAIRTSLVSGDHSRGGDA